jgi:predicted transcriptional regulator
VHIAARVVTAYVANNRMAAVDLPGFIASVHQTVAMLRGDNGDGLREAQKPAVAIKRSLKRHLNSSYGMTPEQYRAKWGLPHDYPMVAPDYAEHRSQLAKAIGLGRKRTGGRRR